MSKQYQCKKCGDNNPRNFYMKSRSWCKKCIIEKSKKRYHNLTKDQLLHYIKNQKYWQENNIFHYRIAQARSRAEIKKIEFNIDADYLEELWNKQNGLCYYSGIPMLKDRSGKYTLSIDRLDSSIGYTKLNIVLCTTISNSMKNSLPIREFYEIIEKIYLKKTSKIE